MIRITLVFILSISCGFANYLNPVRNIGLHMVARSIHNGVVSKVVSNVYYSIDGKMITYNEEPNNLLTITNNKGEVTIYDAHKNEVYQSQNFAFSTEASQLYFFLHNKMADLGLSAMGFQMLNTTFDEGLMVTEWTPSVQLANKIGSIKLVHDKQRPIFMSHSDLDGQIIKKTYFYDYVDLNGASFPSAVTQINFIAKGDSTLTKISYSDIQINKPENEEKLNFQVPAGAKVIKW